MTNFSMIVDVEKCTGCYACFLTCRDEYVGNDHLPYSIAQPPANSEFGQSWIRVVEEERGTFPKAKITYTPIMCQNCEDAPCIEAAKNGAVFRREDGIVMIDPEKADGQKTIADSCPYGVIFWNEEKKVAQKCTFCSHLLDDGWKMPRCAEACPVEAILFGDLDDPDSAISQKRQAGRMEELNHEFGIKPTVAYVGLPKRFIAGEVVLSGDVEECAEGISVILAGDSGTLSTTTDAFGDFEFTGLTEGSDFTIEIDAPDRQNYSVDVRSDTDLNLGVIMLEPLAG